MLGIEARRAIDLILMSTSYSFRWRRPYNDQEQLIWIIRSENMCVSHFSLAWKKEKWLLMIVKVLPICSSIFSASASILFQLSFSSFFFFFDLSFVALMKQKHEHHGNCNRNFIFFSVMVLDDFILQITTIIEDENFHLWPSSSNVLYQHIVILFLPDKKMLILRLQKRDRFLTWSTQDQFLY